jgi:glycosyltransferase involved in cell wall biosynthesis
VRFSLIVATRGRVGEVAEFLDSLLAQGRADAEAILVDQNGDDRLAALAARFAERLPLAWLRSDRPNACHARNLGLSRARGAIVGFPDDDCLYPPGVLAQVDAAFAADPGLQVLTGPAASPAGGLGSGRWRSEAGPITPANAWTSVIEFNLFLRRGTALALGGFDPRLGPGTPFGSAEGNDLVLRATAAGHAARYDPALRIMHPDKRMTAAAAERARLYGTGLGFVLRRHRVPPSVWLPFMVRPIGGAALGALHGDPVAVRHHLGSLRGRWTGFTAPGSADGVPLAPLGGSQPGDSPLGGPPLGERPPGGPPLAGRPPGGPPAGEPPLGGPAA